jgi:hypothetical protein
VLSVDLPKRYDALVVIHNLHRGVTIYMPIVGEYSLKQCQCRLRVSDEMSCVITSCIYQNAGKY